MLGIVLSGGNIATREVDKISGLLCLIFKLERQTMNSTNEMRTVLTSK
jgi:hypothetical protein